MEATPIDPFDAVAVPADDGAVYRVRAWTRPADPAMAWLVEEWDVAGAGDVESVLAWARGLTVHSFEVFVQWSDHRQNAAGEMAPQRRFTRIHGRPADDGGTTETVIFTRDG